MVQHRSYVYRQDGHLTEIEDLVAGTHRFTLDPLGRVTEVETRGRRETYAYDGAGNVVQAGLPGQQADGDRLVDGTLITRSGRTVHEYDGQGRRVRSTRRLLNGQKRSWSYTWDAEDRLVRVTTPDGDEWRYIYD
ncbi:type IV secretion protein Rhs, partial [Streptomyces klenkii]